MRQWLVSTFLLVSGSICVVMAKEPPISAGTPDGAKAKTAQKASPNEAAIKEVSDALLKAYQDENAREFAACFTDDGEYVDIKGVVFHGRTAIEGEFAAFFKETPDSTMELEFTGTRSIASGIITSDCTTRFKRSPSASPIPGRCQLVCTREGDGWLIASLRESETVGDVPAHHDHVSQLDWMVGEWLGETASSHVHVTCRWDDSAHFLLRDFTVRAAETKAHSVSQRIGYDPVSGKLKLWAFDSAGGYAHGDFSRDGATWVLRTSGVTSDGQVASTTNGFTPIDDHRMTAELIDQFIGGERIRATERLTLVRKPPATVDRTTLVIPQEK